MTMQLERTEATAGLGLAVSVAVADVVFVAGVLIPHLAGTDPLGSLWIGLPALLSAFALPLIAYAAVLVAGRRLLREHPGRPIDRAVVALAMLGFLVYVSPWGLAAVRGIMIALD